MKCFERVVLAHTQKTTPATLDPLQYAYCTNRPTEDAVSAALHTALSHLENKHSYVRMLFIDYSSEFNTVIPHKLTTKLFHLSFNSTLCNWLLDFLTGRPQSVRIGSLVSGRITVNTGTLQGCVHSPVLYSLFTHNCVPSHKDNTILKFADDTTVIGLISGGDETGVQE
ncbi:hypothetical protein L3Q82_005692 [Scortum barcoo]|uniref:Uncharacterized protein n=1 Tax=Scortum barcoo TaxID=214431 RepID=A0ACB8V7D3_9TELE|nr:hypothetical protein L3Q82_005692 [Scortum barcoo]